MPNPIKGEVNIEISGKSVPLVFNYDAIAQIESKYDAPILDVQVDMSRIKKVYDFLHAALGGKLTFDELKNADLPPVLEIIENIKQALAAAYFGGEVPEETDEDAPKKKP